MPLRTSTGPVAALAPLLLLLLAPLGADLLPRGLAPVGPVALSAQARAVGETETSVEQHLAEGDRLHGRLQPRDALRAYEDALAIDSTRVEALWKAAREAVTLGMLDGNGKSQEWYGRAEGFARQAVRHGPERADAHHWLSVALGRTALDAGVRTRVKLADEVRGEAMRVLELEPDHAGAHHVLGQWHAEVRRLSGVARFVANRILGGDAFDQASWDEAQRLLERAVELAPNTLIHRLELGRIYLDTDQPDRARAALEEVLRRPAVEAADPLHKQEAQELLRELD